MPPSDLHHRLATTARSFILSTSASPPSTNTMNHAIIRSLCAPNFRITWGPALFAASMPPISAAKDTEGFLSHLATMCKDLVTWEIAITHVVVDVEMQRVVARADFCMVVRGEGEGELERVRNDVVFFLNVDAERGVVEECCEYVDPFASARIREIIARGRKEGNPGS